MIFTLQGFSRSVWAAFLEFYEIRYWVRLTVPACQYCLYEQYWRMPPPDLPLCRIVSDRMQRCWILTTPIAPAPLQFAARGKGAAGLVGAIATAMFYQRETGGILEIEHAGEVLRLWFDAEPSVQLFW